MATVGPPDMPLVCNRPGGTLSFKTLMQPIFSETLKEFSKIDGKYDPASPFDSYKSFSYLHKNYNNNRFPRPSCSES